LLIDFTEVLSGDGGVITTSCLHFLVTNSVDEIRNLEYEYDLMDNVTQRQNHLSGLSESFTYDALDRLTQSSKPAA
jgi:hypothetical protein